MQIELNRQEAALLMELLNRVDQRPQYYEDQENISNLLRNIWGAVVNQGE